VKITAALAAELELLTQALDDPSTDLAESITRLAAAVRTAVDSYLGLSVTIAFKSEQLDLTVLDEDVDFASVRTSLFVPLAPTIIDAITTTTSVALVLYAATPGAFIDLAADLAWITGHEPAEFQLDEHRFLPHSAADPTPLAALSLINQALGVLIGRGSAPELAEQTLQARATNAGTDILQAAMSILAALRQPRSESDCP
jgi:hypothetical protein